MDLRIARRCILVAVTHLAALTFWLASGAKFQPLLSFSGSHSCPRSSRFLRPTASARTLSAHAWQILASDDLPHILQTCCSGFRAVGILLSFCFSFKAIIVSSSFSVCEHHQIALRFTSNAPSLRRDPSYSQGFPAPLDLKSSESSHAAWQYADF